MLPNVKTTARGFVAVAAVGLSGLGFADEPKKEVPPPPKVVEIVRPQPADEKKDADVTAKQLQQLMEALQGKGQLDNATMLELLRKLEKDGALAGTIQQMMKLPEVVDVFEVRPDARGLRLQPPADVIRGGARGVPAPPGESDLRKQYDQQMKDFDERIKKAGDAEAKEQLEKTRDEYKKAMEEPLKKADEGRKDVEAPRRRPDDFERPNRDPNADAMRRLVEMQRDMQRRLMEDVRRLDGPDVFGRADPFDPFAPGGRNAAQPRLGVKVEKVSAVLAEQLDLPKDSGVVIADVTAGSAAEKAGLKKNDVLLKLAGKDVPTDPESFTAMVGKLNAGEKLDAEVLRKGKKETVKGIELPEVRQPGRGGFDRGGFGGVRGGGGGVFGGGGNEQVQIQVNNDEATLQATVGDVGYTVTGTVEKGKLTPTKIVVKEGRESKEYASLDKMPEGERATVERLLGKVRLFGGR